MRVIVASAVSAAIVMLAGITQVSAEPPAPLILCTVCTCQDGAVICIDQESDTLEEQGICGGACENIDSSYKSREVVEAACEDLPACDHAQTPAASPLWLSTGAIALLAFGAARMRRIRRSAL